MDRYECSVRALWLYSLRFEEGVNIFKKDRVANYQLNLGPEVS